LRWSIVIALIAGEARVRLMCSGDLYSAKIWSSQKASRARLRTRIGFARLPRVAARICFSKTAKTRIRLISQLHRWTIRRHLRRRKRFSSKTNCRGLSSTNRFRRSRQSRRRSLTTNLKLGRCPTPSSLTLATLPSMSLIPSAPLKLGRCPTPSPLTLATLPSMSLIPSAPFTDGNGFRMER